jgi:TRAP-type C4-dicarboxylate transport system permease small subunit
VLGFLIISMTLLLFTSVSGRYLFRMSIHWVDAYCRYSLVWITLLGSSMALRNGSHVGIPTLVESFPPRLRLIVEKFDVVFVLAYALAMLFYGSRLIPLARQRIIPEMGFSIAYIYYVFPISAILLIIVAVRLLLNPEGGAITEAEGFESLHDTQEAQDATPHTHSGSGEAKR